MIPREIPPDVRLTLPRSDGGLVRVAILSPDAGRYVEIARFDASGQRGACVTLRPDELDRFGEAIALCRRLLLGTPDPYAAAREAQARAGLAPRKRGR